MKGNLWKVGPNAEELMEDRPKCRGTNGRWARVQGTYGRWAQMQGNLWKVGPSAGELMEGSVKTILLFLPYLML